MRDDALMLACERYRRTGKMMLRACVWVPALHWLACASIAASTTLPANHSLLNVQFTDVHLAGEAAGDGTLRLIDVADAPGFAQAMHVETKRREAKDYDLQCELPLPSVGLHDGDLIWACVWARMLRTEDESGQGLIGLVLEQSQEPFNKLIARRMSVGPQWEQLSVPARVRGNQPAGSLHLLLRVGGAAQTLEIGGLKLLRFDDPSSVDINDLPQTRLTYDGREPDAPWRKAAEERIDKIRKAPLTVRVIDAAGHPIAGASVKIEMRQHTFPFGSAYNSTLIAGPDAQAPANQEYARRFADLFNVGVDENGMKWPSWEVPTRRDITVAALHWMSAHGVRVRGHCLVWPGWRRLPANLAALKNDPPALSKAIDDHIHDEVSALSGQVTEWDVINEPYANNDLMKILGDGAMADWFKLARAADPAARLLLNETSVPTNPPSDQHYDVLFNQIQAIQKAGAPIGGLGMQAHFGSNLTSIADLEKIYARFAALQIPLEITELDIDVNDEQLQADYLRDFMSFSFSEPNISGIMMWGFVENHHWRPDAALWHANWKIKPAGQAWLDLVKKQWWTSADLTTSTDGSAEVRGFLGDYEITASAGGRSQTVNVTLPQQGSTTDVLLK